MALPPSDTDCGGCGRTFPTLADVFSHDCPPAQATATVVLDRPRPLEVVAPAPAPTPWRSMPNVTLGDKARAARRSAGSRAAGRGTTVVAPAPAPAPTTEYERHRLAHLRSMLAERAGVAEAEAIRVRLNEARVRGMLTADVVSAAIDELSAAVPYAGPNGDAHEDGGCRRCARTGLFITGMVNGVPTGPGGPCFRCSGKGRQTDCGTVAHAERQRSITRKERDTTACCDRVRNDLYDRFGIRLSV